MNHEKLIDEIDEECLICFEPCDIKDSVNCKICHKLFHKKCYKKWQKKKKNK